MESLESYLDRLASAAAVPGGGSAAAVSGAMGAALVAMVARIARANPRNADNADNAEALDAIAQRSDELRAELTQARVLDEAAYGTVVNAQAMPRGSAEQERDRRQALDDALAHAAEEPLRSAKLNLELLRVAARLLEFPISALSSDIGSAAELAASALAGCAYNVRVNHKYMRDDETITLQRAALSEAQAEADTLLTQIRQTIKSRLFS